MNQVKSSLFKRKREYITEKYTKPEAKNRLNGDTADELSRPTLEILHKKLWQLAKVEADLKELREFVSYTNLSIVEYKLKEQKYEEEISYLTQTNEILKKQLESHPSKG